jgi:hypothetical protein
VGETWGLEERIWKNRLLWKCMTAVETSNEVCKPFTYWRNKKKEAVNIMTFVLSQQVMEN